MERSLTSQQKGRCGELLVQYLLLKQGIESAPMTTDTGIDLVAYPRKSVIDWPEKRPATIQVKTSSERGKIGEWVEWNVTESCPADYIAAVDLKRNRLWLFKFSDFKAVAKRAGKGQLRLWWPTPDHDWAKAPRHETEFAEYEMENGLHKAFGI